MADAALNEQLNGLIDLLAAVGIDSVNKREIKKASVALKNQGSGAPIVFPSDIPEAKELNDDQIQAMILKLQQANAQAPNLLEAMQDYIDAKNGITSSRGSKKPKKKTGGPVPMLAPPPKERHLYPQQKTHQQAMIEFDLEDEGEEDEEYEYEEEVVEDEQDDHDDYDEDEEDDDFDEDADYPVVGPGVSDDISVVSDMTTPTVVSSIHINDEEHYSDMLPSMYIKSGGKGPPMKVQPPKRKNLVSQVGRSSGGGRVAAANAAAAAQAAGGAASKRRQAYQQTMSRLHQNPYGSSIAGPAANLNVPTIAEGEELHQSFNSHNDHSFASGQDDWHAFSGQAQEIDESARSKGSKTKKKGSKGSSTRKSGSSDPNAKPKKKKPPATGTSIDKEGFLVDEQGVPSERPRKAKDPNGLSKSHHSNASGSGAKKKVKKKLVKKPTGDDHAAPKKKTVRSRPAAH